MAHALHSIENKPEHTVEVVIHVSESLGESRRDNLIEALEEDENIISAEFCPIHYHLMLVRYDRDTSSSQKVLASVEAQNYNARLIGPV